MANKTAEEANTSNVNNQTYGGGVCIGNHHVYPQMYAGHPDYAEQFFNTCLCGKKRRVTTVKEVDNLPTPTNSAFYGITESEGSAK